MEKYLEIAKNIEKIKNFDLNELKTAMKFIDTKNHFEDRHFNITFCGYSRDNDEETTEHFADGNSTHDSATIHAETYWIIEGNYIICSSNKEYSYICQAHSGGVDSVTLENEATTVKKWMNEQQLVKFDWKIMNLIKDFTLFLASSEYENSCSCAKNVKKYVNKMKMESNGLNEILKNIMKDTLNLKD